MDYISIGIKGVTGYACSDPIGVCMEYEPE